jgi:hypothetical protein
MRDGGMCGDGRIRCGAASPPLDLGYLETGRVMMMMMMISSFIERSRIRSSQAL